MNPRKNSAVLLLVLLTTLLSTLSACRLGRAVPTPIAITLPDQSAAAAAAFTSYTVQKGEVVQDELLSGRVIPAHEEDLFFRRSGQVTKVYVNDGDKIQQGDIIAALDNEVLELDLESALLSLAIAKENLINAEKDLAYRRRQAELNLNIAKVNLDSVAADASAAPEGQGESNLRQIRQLQTESAQLALDNIPETIDPTLELNVKRAELAVERVKQAILEGQIVAPFDGEIRFIDLPTGNEQLAIQAYKAVARLVDTTQFRIELNLPREQLENLREGMAVSISAASIGSLSVPGIIAALPRPFGTSQGSLTEVAVSNADDNNRLSEGITVAINVRLKSKPGALVLPVAALQQEGEFYFVTVQQGSVVERIGVGVGVVGSDLVEITSGLQDGDTVVVQPAQR